jgi:1-acyl-sn-glycerol-3-phosphate acyltransferase
MWIIAQTLLRILTSILFDLKVFGIRHLPRRGGVLLLANHQSYLDPVVLSVQSPRPVGFMARSSLFSHRLFGWLIRSLYAFPVKQGAGDVGAIKETIRRLQGGGVVNIYPEGARTRDGQLGPLQSGVALIVRRAGVPVVPVAIHGAYDAWPIHRSRMTFKPIRVMYGQPMDLAAMEPDQIMATVEGALRRMLAQLAGREART